MSRKEELPQFGPTETGETEAEKEEIDPEIEKILEKMKCSLYELKSEQIDQMMEKGTISKNEAYELYRILSKVSEKQARTDALTGAHNRRGCLERGKAALNRLRVLEDKREKPPQIVIIGMIDINDFKNINDSYGHQAGDIVLQKIAGALKTSVREAEGDIVARVGGDEFVVIVSLPSEENIKAVQDRINNSLANLSVSLQDRSGKSVTLQVAAAVGFTSISKEDRTTPMDELIEKADRAMYEAKKKEKSDINR